MPPIQNQVSPIIMKLVDYNINYNLIVENRNYLIFCCWWNMESTVRYMVEYLQNLDFNYIDKFGNNILFYTAGIYSEQGNLNLLIYLHQKGVNINQVNNEGSQYQKQYLNNKQNLKYSQQIKGQLESAFFDCSDPAFCDD